MTTTKSGVLGIRGWTSTIPMLGIGPCYIGADTGVPGCVPGHSVRRPSNITWLQLLSDACPVYRLSWLHCVLRTVWKVSLHNTGVAGRTTDTPIDVLQHTIYVAADADKDGLIVRRPGSDRDIVGIQRMSVTCMQVRSLCRNFVRKYSSHPVFTRDFRAVAELSRTVSCYITD
jgi:hypothetical protein